MTVGEKIVEMREERGLTTDELAAMAGMRASVLRKYESGETSPKRGSREKLAAALGCDVSYFTNTDSGRGSSGGILETPGDPDSPESMRRYSALGANENGKEMEVIVGTTDEFEPMERLVVNRRDLPPIFHLDVEANGKRVSVGGICQKASRLDAGGREVYMVYRPAEGMVYYQFDDERGSFSV